MPNFGDAGRGARLVAGMTLAVEPMVNAGGAAVRQMPDGWARQDQGRLAEPHILSARS